MHEKKCSPDVRSKLQPRSLMTKDEVDGNVPKKLGVDPKQVKMKY